MSAARVRHLCLFALSLLVGACAITVDWPQEGTSVCPPVQLVASWKGEMSHFEAKLDGVDITSQFSVSYPNQRASAQLNAAPGPHTLFVTGVFQGLFGTSNGNDTRKFEVPGLSIEVQPSSITLARNAAATTNVSAWACGPATVNVTLGPVPAGITANPASRTMTIPAPTNPGIGGTTGDSFTETLGSAPNAPAGRYTINVNAVSGTQSKSAALTLDLGTPTATSVTPTKQGRQGSITIAGTGFDPMCTNNTVTVAGMNTNQVLSCSPAGTWLTLQVPEAASYGPTQVKVTVGGLGSQGVPFTVARQPGAFVASPAMGSTTNPPACVGANNATHTLQITPLQSPLYRATYSSSSASAQSIDFSRDHVTPPPGVGGLGGAGLSACVAGVVVNAGLPELVFLNLETRQRSAGHGFRVDFENAPGAPSGAASRLFNSPDGTLVLLVSPGRFSNVTDHSYYVELFDVDKSRFGQRQRLDECVNNINVAARVTTNNEVAFTCGSTQKTFVIQ